MARRNGFTLIETLIAIVVVALLVLIGYPKVSAALVASDVRGARTAFINAAAQARVAAMQGSRITWLKFQGNQAVILSRPRRVPDGVSDADTIGTVVNLGGYGVTVVPALDSIQFNPGGLGLSLGAGKTITLSRGSHYENIKIDGLGRVTK